MSHRTGFFSLICLLSLLLPVQAIADAGAQERDLDALLARARATQTESLRYLEGLYASEQSLLLPANDRLVVVFLKQDRDVDALLHEIELRIDNQIAEVYSHHIGDLEKMQDGAVIPLHATLLSVGRHSIGVSVTGMDSPDGDGPAKATLAFDTGSVAHFVEIRVTRNGIRFKEWR